MLERFKQALGDHPLAEAKYIEVKTMMDAPGRYYHNWNHVVNMIDILTLTQACSSYSLVAAIYHDCIYIPGNSDNEEASAKYCASVLEEVGVSKSTIEVVTKLILSTKHTTACNGSTEGKLFIDADLLGLGTCPCVYDQNSANIRKEFSKFSDEEWKAGRKKFIVSMLERDSIYHTDLFKRCYEKQARHNMLRELVSL